MKKTKLLALFGSICLTLALIVTLSGGLALVFADKPQDELPPGIEKKVEPVEAEISYDGEVPLSPNIRPVIVVSGSDYDMGYQYYQQLAQILGPWILEEVAHEPFTVEELAVLKAYQWYIRQYTPEFIDMFKGMADGATDAGVPLSYTEVLANFTGTRSYPGTEPPGSEKEKLPPKENECSGFAAWGSTTKDGKLICAGNTDSAKAIGFGSVIVAFPSEGNSFIISYATSNWGIASHPGMNNKGLVYVHMGGCPRPGGTTCNCALQSSYGITEGIAFVHTLRFADNATEAKNMQLAYPDGGNGLVGGLWADVGNGETPPIAFDIECGEPEAVRQAGDYGETDFIYATNNGQCMEMGLEGQVYIPHAGWFKTGATISSVARNLGMWNMFHNYHGEVDLDFAKMMYRFPGEPPDYPTLEEADAAYYPTQGEGWDQKICDLENGTVAIVLPDDGDEGLYYLSTGCAARVAYPLVPHGHYYRIAPTYSFYELKLASSPADVVSAARARAQYQQYYANQELRKLDYWDAPYAPLDEIFNQAATEWQKGEYYRGLARKTTGDESIYNYAKATRAFTACQAYANQVYNSLVPPATCPSDLGLGEWFGDWPGAEWATR